MAKIGRAFLKDSRRLGRMSDLVDFNLNLPEIVFVDKYSSLETRRINASKRRLPALFSDTILARWAESLAGAGALKEFICTDKPVDVSCSSSGDFALDPCMQKPRVVIIGAGMAGIVAASRLFEKGLDDVIILEGSSRIGGRIYSCWLGNAVAEAGAQWIHGGGIANPVFTLAVQEGLLKDPLPLRHQFSERTACLTSDGRAIESYIVARAVKEFKRIQNQAYTLFSVSKGTRAADILSKAKGKSLEDFFRVAIEDYLMKSPVEDRLDLARVIFGLTNGLRCRWGEDLALLSAENYGSFIEIPGRPSGVPKGFAGVLAPLLKKMDYDSIHYNKVVKRVHWDRREPRALVECCDGTQYPAHYIILTVSLGVLKRYYKDMFCPELPASKVRAIKKLGYGHINKIFVEYERPFWVPGEGKIKLAWKEEELPRPEKTEWERGVAVIEEVPGSGHLLTCTVSGKEALCMEQLSESRVALALTRLLRRFTGDPTLPPPCRLFRSMWSSDPLFHGASSFMGLEAGVEQQCDLAAPLGPPSDPRVPSLLFAGEATTPGYFSTVQGAQFSGIREADRILHLTQKNFGPPKQEAPAPAVC